MNQLDFTVYSKDSPHFEAGFVEAEEEAALGLIAAAKTQHNQVGSCSFDLYWALMRGFGRRQRPKRVSWVNRTGLV